MAKQRYINDSFWTDPYIEKLSPDYKLIFLYLLTNPLSNISGVYEIRLKRIAYETGYDIEAVENIINKFVTDKKVIQAKDWIILVNHIKYQSLGDLTAKGINREIQDAPQEIQSLFEEKTLTNSKGDEYSILVLKENQIPLTYPLQAPTFGALSKVKLSRVDLSNKKTYGEFENVLLKEEEYIKLVERLGETNTNIMIEKVSRYIAQKTKDPYKNHYATILSWTDKKVEEHQSKILSKTKTIA